MRTRSLVIEGNAGAAVVSCTITRNFSGSYGGGVQLRTIYPLVTFERTILAGNCAGTSGDDLWQDAGSATARFTCSAVDPARITGTAEYVGDPVREDPRFCDPRACSDASTVEGGYAHGAGSPCLPARSPCGLLIGALDAGCSPEAIEAATWGALKAIMRGAGR